MTARYYLPTHDGDEEEFGPGDSICSTFWEPGVYPEPVEELNGTVKSITPIEGGGYHVMLVEGPHYDTKGRTWWRTFSKTRR